MSFIVFIIGLCVGSFVNVVAYSIPKKLDFMKRRSFCDCCRHQLSFIDMIPIMSFILLKGRCRYCRHSIPIRYSFVELLCGFIAVIFYNSYSVYYAVLLFIFMMIFIVISLIDIDTMIIYDTLLLCLFIIGMFALSYYHISFVNRFIGMIVISLPLILFNHFVIESFGGGDIKLYIILGFLLGIEGVLCVFVYSVFCASFVSFLLMIIKKINKNFYIPFVPFITFGVYVYLLYGNLIYK